MSIEHSAQPPSDSDCLDWLEKMANQRGGILLHDGSEGGRLGLGLRPGTLNRTLRQAITAAIQSGNGAAGQLPQPADSGRVTRLDIAAIDLLREIDNHREWVKSGSVLQAAQRMKLALAEQGQGEAVATVDAGEEGLFVDIIYGPNGSELKVGDQLYLNHAPPASPAGVPNADTARLDWLERHPRLAEFVVEGRSTDCYMYAVAGAPGVKLREIIDATMASEPRHG